jgi:heme/copper-type cytochrome/quinol oxidase subunit 2
MGAAMQDEAGNFDMGVAGSLTMIILTLAVVFLMVSFYRRYKRLLDRKDQE